MHKLDRRTFVTAGAAALTLARVANATTDTAAAAGDWLILVKQQHAVITGYLNQFIDSAPAASAADRLAGLKRLNYLLTSHSVAEENVLYPAVATHGLEIGAAELYLEQDAQKVLNSVINLEVQGIGDSSDLINQLVKLRTLIVAHAINHEENDLYPRLRDRATASENDLLTQNYLQFYSMVQGVA
jgi:hemerythrin superfamily protein